MSNNVEEIKIISKLDKIFKQIDPNSKKQITELSENAEFRKNVENIKEYLQSYIGKTGLDKKVFDKAKELTAFCDNEYKNLVDKRDELEQQAKDNVEASKLLNEVYLFAVTRENFSVYENALADSGLGDYIDHLKQLSNSPRNSKEYAECEKTIKSKINNLEGNLHIDIDLERIADKEKALSYISIELDNVLARLTNAVELIVELDAPDPIIESELLEKYEPDFNVYGEYVDDSLVLIRTDLWSKFVNSKFVLKVKELFVGSNVKALNAGITTAKTE